MSTPPPPPASSPSPYWDDEAVEAQRRDGWSWHREDYPLPQMCDDLAWFDNWVRSRREMGLDTEIPERVMAYLRSFLHHLIDTRDFPGSLDDAEGSEG